LKSGNSIRIDEIAKVIRLLVRPLVAEKSRNGHLEWLR
jgi:hypothetical protein